MNDKVVDRKSGERICEVCRNRITSQCAVISRIPKPLAEREQPEHKRPPAGMLPEEDGFLESNAARFVLDCGLSYKQAAEKGPRMENSTGLLFRRNSCLRPKPCAWNVNSPEFVQSWTFCLRWRWWRGSLESAIVTGWSCLEYSYFLLKGY